MFPEEWIDCVGVDPRGNRPLAGRKANAAFVFALLPIVKVVLLVGTGTAAFESVHAVARTAFGEYFVNVPAHEKNRHMLRQSAHVAFLKVSTSIRAGTFKCRRIVGLHGLRLQLKAAVRRCNAGRFLKRNAPRDNDLHTPTLEGKIIKPPIGVLLRVCIAISTL
jgi:hypothetical protein